MPQRAQRNKSQIENLFGFPPQPRIILSFENPPDVFGAIVVAQQKGLTPEHSTTHPKAYVVVVGVRDAVAPDQDSTVGIVAAQTAAAENAIAI